MKKSSSILMNSCSFFIALNVLISGFSQKNTAKVIKNYGLETVSKGLIYDWAKLQLKASNNNFFWVPPIVARGLAYSSLTMYESVVPVMPEYKSAIEALRLKDTNKEINFPALDINKNYHWGLCMNAAQAQIMYDLFSLNDFEKLTGETQIDIKNLEKKWEIILSKGVSKAVIKYSIELGRAISKSIYEWSKTDGGHDKGHHYDNFPQYYVLPKFEGSYQYTHRTERFGLLPFWGNNTLIISNNLVNIPNPIKYSTDKNSDYYKQYHDVYEISKKLTTEQKEMAIWWADRATFTATATGHSFSMVLDILEKEKVKIPQLLETLTKVSIALNDAMIACWRAKYTYLNERPETYIRREIDPNWSSYLFTPAFPGYVSGHATQAAAMAEVMTSVLGPKYKFTDSTHANNGSTDSGKLKFRPRHFNSFAEAAKEIADSRIYGGIHTSQDNVMGAKIGSEIGKNLVLFRLKK